MLDYYFLIDIFKRCLRGSVPHVFLVFILLNSYYSANKFLIMFRTGALKKSSIRGFGCPKHIFWLEEAGEKKLTTSNTNYIQGKFERFRLRPLLVPKTSTLKWLFQLDESKPLQTGNGWKSQKTSIKTWWFRVPGCWLQWDVKIFGRVLRRQVVGQLESWFFSEKGGQQKRFFAQEVVADFIWIFCVFA